MDPNTHRVTGYQPHDSVVTGSLSPIGGNTGDVYKLRKMLVPINKNNEHWILGCINFEKYEIVVYDSLEKTLASYSDYVNCLRSLVIDKWNEKMDREGKNLPCPNWTVRMNNNWARQSDHDIWSQKQDNGCDCGAFMLAGIIKFLALPDGKEEAIRISSMETTFRRRIKFLILKEAAKEGNKIGGEI